MRAVLSRPWAVHDKPYRCGERSRGGRRGVKELGRTADVLAMAWRDNWFGYAIAVVAIVILGFIWLDTRSDIEREQRPHANIPAARAADA